MIFLNKENRLCLMMNLQRRMFQLLNIFSKEVCMNSQFKLNLVFSKIIAFLGLVSILTIILELLKILPGEIMSYLVGFSFVVSPILFISSLINYILILILFITKYNYEKSYSNMKWSIGFTFIGVMPFMFYFIMILIFGF